MVEMLITMALAAMVLAMAVVSSRGGQSRASSRALAERVAGELKVARQQAIATREPVAVVFPGQGGTRPHSQSLYVLAGNENPRIQRVSNFATESPNQYLFVGHWALASSTNAAGLGTAPSNRSDFKLTGWNVPVPGDYPFVFTPSGGLVSDRVSFDGACHILVCEGANWGAANVGSTSSFLLSQVFAPFTITVTATGSINVTPGLVGSDASQVLATSSLAVPPPASPPPAPGTGNTPPTITLSFAPTPNPATLPPGADATVDLKDGYLTLITEVSDADGDHLKIDWTSDRGGAFSSPSVDLEWDPAGNGGAGAWRSVWTWVPPPPPALSPGDVVTLSCTVTDERGATATATLGAAGKVELTRLGKIAFDSNRDGGAAQIYIMNGDGTNQRRITGGENHLACYFVRPRFSPDGTKIVCESCYYGGNDLVVLNSDGTGLHQLTHPGGSGLWAGISGCSNPTWSADGTRIAFQGAVAGGYRSFWINADGSKPSNPSVFEPDPLGGTTLNGQNGATAWKAEDLTSPTAGFIRNFPSGGFQQLFEQRLDGTSVALTSSTWDQNDAACSPDGSRLAYESTETSARDIWVADYSTGALGARVNLTHDTFSEWAPTWSPDGTQIAFASDRTGNSDIFVMRNDGTQVARLTTSPAIDKNPCWAP